MPKKTAPDALPLYTILARRWGLRVLVAALGLAAAGIAVNKLQRHVERRMLAQATPPMVVLKDRPSWMSDDLVKRIIAAASPERPSSAFDRTVLAGSYAKLMAKPDVAPWILSVNQLRRTYGKQPGDTLELDCTFRIPGALIYSQGKYHLIDTKGYQLPEVYTNEQLSALLYPSHTQSGRPTLRILDGVALPPFAQPGVTPPAVPADITAGLEMAALLNDKPYANDVLRIDLTNLGARRDKKAAQITFITRHDTEIRWGRPPTAPDFFVEVMPQRKFEAMKTINARFGRPDANQPWIDLRGDKVIYPTPVDASGATAAVTR